MAPLSRLAFPSTVAQLFVTLMATMDVYGFAHEDLKAARTVVENTLSIILEEAAESDGCGSYFRGIFLTARVCRFAAISVQA